MAHRTMTAPDPDRYHTSVCPVSDRARLRLLLLFATLVFWSPPAHATESLPPLIPEGEVMTGTALAEVVKGFERSFVNSVAWSPDGSRIATSTGTKGGAIQLWDASTGRKLRRFSGHHNIVSSVAWSPDGKLLATGSYDNTIRIWDADNGRELNCFEGHTKEILSISWSPDGTMIASGGNDDTLRLWNVSSGRDLHRFDGLLIGSVTSVAWSHDGNKLAVSSANSNIIVLDVVRGYELHRSSYDDEGVFSVAWSPDGRQLATGNGNTTGNISGGMVRLWDALSGRYLRSFEGHTGQVHSVAWSPDGRRLASAGDGTVRVWDVASGRELRRIEAHRYTNASVVWSPDGSQLASGSLWDAASGRELRRFDSDAYAIESIKWSPDGSWLASGSFGNTILLWDAASGRELRRFVGHSSAVKSVSWSPDGSRLASGSDDATVRLWDTVSGRELHRFEGHGGSVRSVAWSPDGRRLASGSTDKTVRLWDVTSGRELSHFVGHTIGVLSVAWSPDGRLLASSGGGENMVRLWDIAGGGELRRLEGHGRTVFAVAWSPDGSRLASASSDQTVRIWEAANGRELRRFEGHGSSVTSVAWSPDGRRLASGASDQTVRIWDVADGRELRRFDIPGDNVISVAWSPDSRQLAAVSLDQTVRVWDVATGHELERLASGRDGRWLACKPEGSDSYRCWRHDDGQMVQRVAADGLMEPVLPPQSGAPAWQFDALPQAPLGVSLGEASRVTVSVRNTGQGPGFWGRLVATPVNAVDPAVRVLTSGNEPLFRLDPGEATNLSLALIGSSRTENPLSGSVDLALSLVHAFGTEPIGRVTARVAAPELRIAAASLDARDLRTLTLSLINDGAQAAPGLVGDALLLEGEGPSSWKKSFEQRIDRPDPIPPGATVSLALPLPTAVSRLDQTARIEVSLLGVAPPLYRWRLEAPVLVPGWPVATYAGLVAAVLALMTLAYWAAVLRYPVLVAVSRRPTALLEVAPEGLAALDRRLRWAFRRRGLLARAEVPEPRFLRAAGFAGLTAKAQVQVLAERLNLKSVQEEPPAPTHGVRIWSAEPPEDLPLNLPRLRLAFPPPGLSQDEVLEALQANEHGRGVVALVIAGDPEQRQALRASALDPDAMVAVPDGAGLTALLLAAAPLAVLARLISNDVRVTQISLYKANHGVDKTLGFFGRERELVQILNREPGNYFLIAARQIGKTSLMQEIKRRCGQRPGLDALYCSLTNADPVAPLAHALKLPVDAGLAEVLAALPPPPGTRRLVLIDEADLFVAAEAGRGFPLLSAFRTLSAEGRVHFILAGFWELYRTVGFDYQSPLRNFGDELRLGPLERDAALKLATEPMAALNLHYADPALPERIYERTGGRANLIAIVCDRLLAGLDGRTRVIDAAAVNRALNQDQLFSAFRGWDTLSGDQSEQARADNRLDRRIVLATVGQGSFTAGSLQRRLAATGEPQEVTEIDRALLRLQIAAIVRREADGVYRYTVPLFVDMLREFDLQ